VPDACIRTLALQLESRNAQIRDEIEVLSEKLKAAQELEQSLLRNAARMGVDVRALDGA